MFNKLTLWSFAIILLTAVVSPVSAEEEDASVDSTTTPQPNVDDVTNTLEPKDEEGSASVDSTTTLQPKEDDAATTPQPKDEEGSASVDSTTTTQPKEDDAATTPQPKDEVLPPSAEVETWSPLCKVGSATKAQIGDHISLCLFLSADPPLRMVFRVKVDDHAELVLRGSQKKSTLSNSNVYIWAAGSHNDPVRPLDCSDASDVERRGNHVSCPQLYVTPKQAVHMSSLVVNLRDGEISSFAWDNNCAGCGPDRCLKSSKKITGPGQASGKVFERGACGASLSEEGCRADGNSGCDLKVFVTFAGTDRKGNHLKSAGTRLSKFTGYTLASIWDKGKQNYRKIVD